METEFSLDRALDRVIRSLDAQIVPTLTRGLLPFDPPSTETTTRFETSFENCYIPLDRGIAKLLSPETEENFVRVDGFSRLLG